MYTTLNYSKPFGIVGSGEWSVKIFYLLLPIYWFKKYVLYIVIIKEIYPKWKSKNNHHASKMGS